MQRYKILTGILVAAAFLAGGNAIAATPKIGVFNVNYVVAHSKRGQAAGDALKALVKKKKASLDKEQTSLKTTQKSLKAVENKKTDKFKKQFTQYEQSVGAFKQHIAKGQQEIQKRRSDLYQPIIKDLNDVLQQYAKDHHYTLIINEAANSVAFAAKSYNINDELVDALNKFEGE